MQPLRKTLATILPLALFFSNRSASPAEQGQPGVVMPECDALCGDAAGYAKIHGVSSAEALKRLRLQRSIGRLDAEIAKGEPDTYAGLWIRHKPTYGIEINMAGDPDVVSKYVSGTPLADLVKTHRVEKSMKRLELEQAQAATILGNFDISSESGINVFQNQVEVYVLDKQAVRTLATTLGKAGTVLSEVNIIEVIAFSESWSLGSAAQNALGANEIYFLRGKYPSSGGGDTALVEGVLELSNGCLRVRDDFSSTFSPVWPRDYTYRRVADSTKVVEGSGEIVAEVGKRVGLGGGELSDVGYAELTKSVSGDLNCPQPFWDVNTVQ